MQGDRTFQNIVTGSLGNRVNTFLCRNNPASWGFLDIGSNQGLYSILALRAGATKAVCVEPQGHLAEISRANFAGNDIFDNYEIHNCAIAPTAGNLSLYTRDGHSGRASLVGQADHTSETKIRAVNHEYLNQIQIPGALVVKIDVEGAELLVLTEVFLSDLGLAVTKLAVEVDMVLRHEADALHNLLESQGFEKHAEFGSQYKKDMFYVRR